MFHMYNVCLGVHFVVCFLVHMVLYFWKKIPRYPQIPVCVGDLWIS